MLPKKVAELINSKRVVFITDPQKVDYSFSNGKLRVWKEEIPYSQLLGVLFLKEPKKKPKVRKIAIIHPQVELKNMKTYPYGDDKKELILKKVCEYVGRYLQVVLKRYLGKRDPLRSVRTFKTFWGFRKRVAENHVFMEDFANCNGDSKLILPKLNYYVSQAYNYGYYGQLLLYLGTLIAYHLGLKVPEDKKFLFYLFLPATYAFTNMLYIKQEIFELNDYRKIPLRGQVYTFINEFLYNEAFHEHFIFSLNLFEG